jgi:hypothetical protein
MHVEEGAARLQPVAYSSSALVVQEAYTTQMSPSFQDYSDGS